MVLIVVIVNEFGVSAARVNWGKSDAQFKGNWKNGLIYLVD